MDEIQGICGIMWHYVALCGYVNVSRVLLFPAVQDGLVVFVSMAHVASKHTSLFNSCTLKDTS
jgi:cytochrome c oxidase subunit IV